MKYKCIELTKSRIVIQGVDNSILEFQISDEPTGRELGDIFVNVVNLSYNCVHKYFIIDINREYIRRYSMYIDKKSNKSTKAYLKAKTLGKLYIFGEERIQDYLVFTDKNHKISSGDLIRAHTVQFTGNLTLYKYSKQSSAGDSKDVQKMLIDYDEEFGTKTCIQCDEAILDNLTIYSTLILNYIQTGLLMTKTLILKHNFIHLDTVDEIYCIFKETCGINTIYEHHRKDRLWESKIIVHNENYTKILANFDFNKISIDDIVYRTLKIVDEADNFYSEEIVEYPFKIFRRDIATLLFLVSMWISCNKDDRILNILIIKYKSLKEDTNNLFASEELLHRAIMTIELCETEVIDVL